MNVSVGNLFRVIHDQNFNWRFAPFHLETRAIERVPLVFRGLFDVIDDENVSWGLGRFEL